MTASPSLLPSGNTPRVDAAERFMHSANRSPVGFVLSEVARQLERELAMAMDVAYGKASLQDLEAMQQGVPVKAAPRQAAPKPAFRAVPRPAAAESAPANNDEGAVAPRPRQKVSAEGAGEKNVYEPGQVLFNKGDKADHLAIILEGKVEIFDPSDGKTIATLGAGASFGEQAILEGGVRGASARAFDRVVCLEISTAPLRAILKSDPGILTPIVESMLLQLNMANKLAKIEKSEDQIISYEVLSQSRMSTTQLQNLLLEIYNTGDTKGLSSEGLMFLKLQASDKLRTTVQPTGDQLGHIHEDNFASAFIVVEGHVDAESERYKYSLGPGSVLGLAEGVTDSPLGWTLTALDHVTLMNLPIDKVLRGLDHANPEIRGIVRYIADRVLELKKTM
ncbi:MAG: cyclic nucleotide-binding domain-containing protein [Limnohabitans sp.]